VLLLHGLGGHAREWEATTDWLTERAHVVAFDARGHGDSERHPDDVSPGAHVADAASVIEELELAPAIVIGQSYGGLTAFLLAGERPDLVRALVVAEATPEPGDESVAAEFEQLLRDLPPEEIPPWAGGSLDVDLLVRTLRGAIDQVRWDLWTRIRCPTLVVRGEDGAVGRDEARAMAEALPDGDTAEIAGAGHNLHLDNPADWREAIEGFLNRLSDTPSAPA
jgi:pimeloyl-ACP methyl ester carboxylesterase